MSAGEHRVAQLLNLRLVFGVPDFAGGHERLQHVLILFFRREHELLVRADDAVVERRAEDDLFNGVLDVDVAIDDHRHVARADAE